MQRLSLALLIDAENVSHTCFPQLIDRVHTLGEPIEKRIFGDFSENRLNAWIALAKVHGLQPEFQLPGGPGKNSCDIALVIHAMDILHGKLVSGICLVSSDRDFAPLAQRLRLSGLKVFGFGSANASSALRDSCTQFFEIETRRPERQTAVHPISTPRKTADGGLEKPLVAHAIRSIVESDGSEGSIDLSRAAVALRRHDPALAKSVCVKGKFLKNLINSGAIDHDVKDGGVRIRATALRAVM